MATKAELQARDLYQGLMEEAKARALSINILSNDQRGVPSPLVREYAFLQLRMLCEIIGLACLVAHGDLVDKGPAALRKAYAPGEIIKILGQLHDDFFPVPVTPQKVSDGWHMGDYYLPFLKKEEVPVLWALCGTVLHRGNLKKLIKHRTPVQHTFDEVNIWGQKILNLLSNHRIVTLDRRLTFVTFLQVNDLGGVVQVALAEASDLS